MRKWVREYGDDPSQSFPGKGQMKPKQLEIDRLRREVAKLKAERAILKRPQPTLPGTRYEVRVHCKAPFDLDPFVVAAQRPPGRGWHGSAKRLRFLVQVSMPGSIVSPVNALAMIRFCWTRSGRASKPATALYGASRVWHDVLEEGLSCGLHRIERLMRLNSLRAGPRRRGLPKDAGDRTVIMPKVLDRQFMAERPNHKWVADFTYI